MIEEIQNEAWKNVKVVLESIKVFLIFIQMVCIRLNNDYKTLKKRFSPNIIIIIIYSITQLFKILNLPLMKTNIHNLFHYKEGPQFLIEIKIISNHIFLNRWVIDFSKTGSLMFDDFWA